jgi:hypothetical protein
MKHAKSRLSSGNLLFIIQWRTAWYLFQIHPEKKNLENDMAQDAANPV